MFPETVETERLTLRQLSTEYVDAFELYDLFSHRRDDVDDVFAYVPQEPYTSIKEAQEWIERAETEWADSEEAQYAVYTPDEELAGYVGLFFEWERRTGRLGVTLGKPYWGNGYASECLRRLTDLAFDRFDLDVVAIGHEEGNDRSRRMIETFVETVGGQYEGRLRNWTPLGDEIADHHRYTVTAQEYRGATE
jgi:ribosomal-protein-alanine N-acetyltransferase